MSKDAETEKKIKEHLDIAFDSFVHNLKYQVKNEFGVTITDNNLLTFFITKYGV